jgi:hypothetical protein
MPVQPTAISSQEYRPFAPFADGQVDRRAVRGASGIVTTFPPLRVITTARNSVSRLGGQTGTQAPTLRPNHLKPGEAGPGTLTHILPADYAHPYLAPSSGLVGYRSASSVAGADVCQRVAGTWPVGGQDGRR